MIASLATPHNWKTKTPGFIDLGQLVGARDGRTQSARACLFFFLHSKPSSSFFNKFLILILVVNFEFHPVCRFSLSAASAATYIFTAYL